MAILLDGIGFLITFAGENNDASAMSTQSITHTISDFFKTQPVHQVWLFGSYARGEETPDSDLDLLVRFDHSKPIGLFAYARMWRELEERLGMKVDLVEEGTLRPAVEESINRDKKIIYERAS